MAKRPAAPLPPLTPGIIDRAIGALSPQWALKRHRSRVAMAATGGYVSAGYSDRFTYWAPGNADADGDAIFDLRELRARSRDQVRNNPLAGGYVETSVTHIIGSGLRMQSRIDAAALGLDDDTAAEWQSKIERLYSLWENSTYSDVDDELTVGEQQELALRTSIESGDGFVVLSDVQRPGWPFTLALQVVEADRVCNPQFAANTALMTEGIERSESGAPIAVHICSKHPGARLSPGPIGATWRRVTFRGATGRRNILHLKRKLRPGQTRGIPELAPILGILKQMDRYSNAEIDAAVNSAALAVFVQMDADAFGDLYDDTAKKTLLSSAQTWDGTIKSGGAINLMPGESVTSPTPGRPNPNFDPFMSAFMRFLGIGLNIPYEVLSKHFQSSYSAARAALMDAWRTFLIRRRRFAAKICQPVYEEWLADCVASGLIAAPGFFADPITRAAWCGTLWSGDGPGALDPLKEAKAMRERMDIGVSTLASETAAYDGGDWEANHRQRAREVDERVEAGLQAPLTAPVAPGAPGAPGLPEPADPTDTEDDLDPESPGGPNDPTRD